MKIPMTNLCKHKYSELWSYVYSCRNHCLPGIYMTIAVMLKQLITMVPVPLPDKIRFCKAYNKF